MKKNEIPFGNSAFQIVNFVKDQHGDARAYRSILLNIADKQKAMNECRFKRRRIEIDIREIEEKLKTATGFEKERLEIDIEEKTYYLEEEVKLIEDCIAEIVVYQKLLEKYKDFTREEFEKEELTYWLKRLFKMALLEMKANGSVSVGTLQSLDDMGYEIIHNKKKGLIHLVQQKQITD